MLKEIKWFPGYQIDEKGNIYSMIQRANQPKPTVPRLLNVYDSAGYKAIRLVKNGKPHKRFIHRLLLETFVGAPKQGQHCRHLNGDKKDNRLKNLVWGTRSENMMDRVRHGTDNRGEKHGMNKYSKAQVLAIRKMCQTMQRKDVANQLGIPTSAVISICNGRGWSWLDAA